MICLIPSRLGRRMEDGPQGKLSIINCQLSITKRPTALNISIFNAIKYIC